MTTRPFAGGGPQTLGVTGLKHKLLPNKGKIERVSGAGPLPMPADWTDFLTERIRVAMGEKETNTSAGNTVVMAGILPQVTEGEGAAEIGETEVTTPIQTKSTIPDLNTWDNRDTNKLVLEITRQVFNELETEGFIPSDQSERNLISNEIRSSIYTNLYRPRNPGDPQYVAGNPTFAMLTPLDRKINITVATFEDLIERNGKDNWNLNFNIYRKAEIREELFEQELMTEEVYEALKGSTLYMEVDYTSGSAIQIEAANTYMMMTEMEPTITREALDRSDVNSYRELISSYVKGAKPNDIKKGIFNATADNLPITGSIAKKRAIKERERMVFDRFAAEGNLKEGVNTLLGFLEDDDDGINKKARSRFLIYLENLRASQIRNGMPEDELIQFMFNSTLRAATATRFNEETEMEDPSIWDTILREEINKVQVVKDEKARTKQETEQNKQRTAEEKIRKEQEAIAKAQRAWVHTQLDAEDVLYKAAKNKPEDFRDDYLEDPSYRGQVDNLIERYKTQGRPQRNPDGDIVKYSDPMGMTPSGKFAFFPDITYRDRYTGDIVTIPHSEMDNHLDRMGDRLAYQLQSIYDQTPEDMFNAQTGRAGIPSLPFDPMKFMPQTRKGDLYTTSPTGEQIPLYPYADPNEMGREQAFPGRTLPGSQYEPPASRTTDRRPEMFTQRGRTVSSTSPVGFDLAPEIASYTDPRTPPPPPELVKPVKPMRKIDFMALSEPEF